MKFVFSISRFLGLLDEPPPIRKNCKRCRACDDFLSDDLSSDDLSSDDETLENGFGFKQLKKIRWSDTVPTNGRHKRECKHSNPVRNVWEQIKCAYATCTPKESYKQTVAVDLPELSRNRPSSLSWKTTQEEPKVACVESKISENTKKKLSIVHLALDDNDSNGNQQDDDVIFVKEVTTPPPNRPLKHFHALNNHAASLNDNILEEVKSYEKIKPMSKRKPIGDDKLAYDAASFKMQQNTRTNVFNSIKLDNKLNSDTDFSDSDIEVVPPESTTTYSIKKASKKDITVMSRNWLLELDAKYNKLQEKQENNTEPHRVSDITSNVNSKQTACSSTPETIKNWLEKLDGKYFLTPVKTTENLNDGQGIGSQLNSKQNETQLYQPDIARDKQLKLESNHNSGLKSQEKLSEAPQESKITSKVNSDEQDVAHSNKVDNIRIWLTRLESEYFSTPQKTQEHFNNSRQESNIVPKMNREQDGIHSFNLNISRQSEYETKLKTLEKFVGECRESDRLKMNKEKNEARSYLPSTSREWLLELDAKYKLKSQENQENLNIARQKLKTLSKVNSEQNEVHSLCSCCAELKCKYSDKHDEMRRVTLVSRVNSEQNQTPKLVPKHKTNQEVDNLSKVKQNTVRSFKFNNSEDLILKLGTLYEKDRQESQEKYNNANLRPDYIKLVGHEHGQNQSNVELPALTLAEEDLVDRALEPEPQEEMLIEKFNIRIYRRDLLTLSDLNWLNDEVINFYMNLVMQRSEERKDLPKVYATNTFFYPKLMQSGQAGLRRWTRKVDIFTYDLFVVPVNIGNHWCIALIDFRARMIKYLDSQGMPNQECLDALLQYLKDEHQEKRGAPFDTSGWKTECLKDIPQQMNGSDCGMFACTFAEFSSRNAAYSFTQAHMPYLRRKAALEILMGRLLL